LDGGEGDEDAVIAPQVPAGGLIGQAVLDDESHRHGNDAMGVARSGSSVFGSVRVEELVASGAVVLRIIEMDVAGSSANQVAQIMQDARVHGLPKGTFATAWTRAVCEIPAAPNDLRLWQFFWVRDAFGGVW
jgi:hypothetical protein